MVSVAVVLAGAAAEAGDRWDKVINGANRFVVLGDYGGAAVLDKETLLVWEQAPSELEVNWADAHLHCNRLQTGGRLGWRLPTIQELASLVDPAASETKPALFLPPGHPFSNVRWFSPEGPGFYWSATTLEADATLAWIVYFGGGAFVGPNFVKADARSSYAWCVRGGPGVDHQ
jgi:hypothetical protein